MPTGKLPFEELQGLINRLEDKLDDRLSRIEDKVQEVSVITIKNSVVLDEHMRRTAAAEKANELLEEKVDLQRQDLSTKITEVKKQTDEIADSLEGITSIPTKAYNLAKWITSIAAAAGVIFTVLKFFMKVI